MSDKLEQKTSRKQFSSEMKFKIVKEQLTTKTPISEICRKYDITSKSFYNWQDQFFKGAKAGFSDKRGPQGQSLKTEREVLEFQTEIDRMREVIAEITSENIAFKKKNLVFLR